MKSPDTRVQFTRNALKEAMLTLMKEKPVGRMTVKELCETAGINRGTFYLHYDVPPPCKKTWRISLSVNTWKLFRSYLGDKAGSESDDGSL